MEDASQSNRNLLTIILDLTPSFWGLCDNVDFSLPHCIESTLGLANFHMMLSPLHEVAVIGVTPELTQFLYPSKNPPLCDGCRDGQYDLLFSMNETVRNGALMMVKSCAKPSGSIVLSGAILKALCHYVRRCRDLHPTHRLEDANVVELNDLSNKLSGRILIVKAADDNPSQYLSLMNTIFSAQKLHINIDTCFLSIRNITESKNNCDSTRHSSLLQQAADLTGGLYVHIPNNSGLLQYLLSVFLPPPSFRKRLLPDIYSSGLGSVDFRAACFCHRQLVDMGYVCSVCLSVFCEFTPLCTTCGSPFTVPGVNKQEK